jgi:inosine-uridine nucleoside N-ribohydrolase
MIGFSTNMARLLDSDPDEDSELTGLELFEKKVSHVVMMAANFEESVKTNPTLETREYNIIKDVPAAQAFLARCPRSVLLSGMEVGAALMYPGAAAEPRFGWVERHPVADAYGFYRPMPYDRPSWDLTAVLTAVRPDGGYFGLSEPGKVVVEDSGIVRFIPDTNGRHRHLTLINSQQDRIIKTMVDLVTQPTTAGAVHITATMRTLREAEALQPPSHPRSSHKSTRTAAK